MRSFRSMFLLCAHPSFVAHSKYMRWVRAGAREFRFVMDFWIFQMCSRFSQCSAVFFSSLSQYSCSLLFASQMEIQSNETNIECVKICKSTLFLLFMNFFFACFFVVQFAMQKRKSRVIFSEWQQCAHWQNKETTEKLWRAIFCERTKKKTSRKKNGII